MPRVVIATHSDGNWLIGSKDLGWGVRLRLLNKPDEYIDDISLYAKGWGADWDTLKYWEMRGWDKVTVIDVA